MDVVVNYMDKMSILVSRLTIEYYVLKKNRYNHNYFHSDFDVSMNKSISCNCINILYCTSIKPAWKCGTYDIDNVENKVGVNILFICKDIKEKVKIFLTGGKKMYFNSRCQPPWSAILKMLAISKKQTFLTITL